MKKELDTVALAAAEKVTLVPEIETMDVPVGNGPATVMPVTSALALATVARLLPSVVLVEAVVIAPLGCWKPQLLNVSAASPVLVMVNCLLTGVPAAVSPNAPTPLPVGTSEPANETPISGAATVPTAVPVTLMVYGLSSGSLLVSCKVAL